MSFNLWFIFRIMVPRVMFDYQGIKVLHTNTLTRGEKMQWTRPGFERRPPYSSVWSSANYQRLNVADCYHIMKIILNLLKTH
jgi:hypothetical protein